MPELFKPGIYRDIPEDVYHSLPYLGSSTLKRFADNPYASQQPFEPSEILAKIMLTGSAVHKLVLEGRSAYESRFTVAPQCDKRTKAGKEAWESFVASANGKDVIDQDQSAAVEGMAKSLKDHPSSKIMLNRGANEVTIIWRDIESGIMCKARPDDYFNNIAMDLKSCSDVSKFHRDVYYLHYDLQATHYMEGLSDAGESPEAFVFVAVQSSKTYPVRVGQLTPEHQSSAKAEWRRLINLYAQCQNQGVWPNYKIPGHIYDLDAITPYDLMEEF